MKHYFTLHDDEKQLILRSAEQHFNYSSAAIEKDIWICWLLETLFQLPIQMAFKGGTSLSRVFHLIHRYSEDIDITLDYRNFCDSLDLATCSRSQLKKISKQLLAQLATCVKGTILPYLNEKVSELKVKRPVNFTLSDNHEKLKCYYPSALSDQCDYMRDHVLLEFGIRNSTEPCQQHTLSPIIASYHQQIKLPTAMINVLSPIRTFWEKATLIHVECHRNRLANMPGNLSRHWYDLAQLACSDIGKQAVTEKNILLSVLDHKKAFFNASYAHYDDCLSGKFLLVPSTTGLDDLNRDYLKMQQSGFFSKTPPKFNDIINKLTQLQNRINSIQ